MIAEYIRISMGIGELFGMSFLSGVAGATIALWIYRRSH